MYSWTKEKVAYLKEHWLTDSLDALATALGTTKNSCIGKASRVKLPFRAKRATNSIGHPTINLTKYPAEQLATLQGLIDQRVSYHMVAVAFCEDFPDVPMRKSIISSLIRRGYLRGSDSHPVIFRPRPQSTQGTQRRISQPTNVIPFEPRKLTIEQLENNSCRKIIGDPSLGSHAYYFCGVPEADIQAGNAYCLFHGWGENGCYKR